MMGTQVEYRTQDEAPDRDLIGKIVWGEMFEACQSLGLDFDGYAQICNAARAMVDRQI
jgi:hypothetical protein